MYNAKCLCILTQAQRLHRFGCGLAAVGRVQRIRHDRAEHGRHHRQLRCGREQAQRTGDAVGDGGGAATATVDCIDCIVGISGCEPAIDVHLNVVVFVELQVRFRPAVCVGVHRCVVAGHRGHAVCAAGRPLVRLTLTLAHVVGGRCGRTWSAVNVRVLCGCKVMRIYGTVITAWFAWEKWTNVYVCVCVCKFSVFQYVRDGR